MEQMNKLVELQRRLKAPKDKKNSFGGYSYRSAEGILEALKPLLASTGTVLTLDDDIVEMGGRVYVRATRTLWNGEDGIPIASVKAFRREPEDKKGSDASQITGAASSYARKYALNGLFAIDDNKDADTDEYALAAQNAEKQKVAKAEATFRKAEEKKRAAPAPKTEGDSVPLQWATARCEICGKPVDPKIREGCFKKYDGHIFCSGECKEKSSYWAQRVEADSIQNIQSGIEKNLKGRKKA